MTHMIPHYLIGCFQLLDAYFLEAKMLGIDKETAELILREEIDHTKAWPNLKAEDAFTAARKRLLNAC